ncbi:MAG: energy transducer TonB [Flavobacteriaceae bacterium]|nr:energy transducer TonB [Flavobacteriaceae bacterium]
MKLFQTEQEKKSIIITSSSFVLLFLLFFFLKFSDSLPLPEMEGGGGGGEIAVNFGDSDFGSGEKYDSKEVVTAAPEEIVEAPVEEKEIVVAENEEAPAIVKVKKSDPKIEKKEEDKPVVKQVPKPSKSTSDALSNLLNGSNKEGDGNDKTAGNKGKSNGDTNSKGYNGGGGSGTGSGGGNGSGEGLGTGSGYGTGSGSGKGSGNGNWKLDGRKLSSSSKQQQKCNEYGTVVVQIKVNRNGNVIAAKYSKGTDNTSQCLLDAAYATAKSYKWQPDTEAPETQIGYITINFKLGQ